MSQGPNDFENGKNESLQRHAIMEMAEMGHYGTVQILKRRIDKNDEARDECRGPRSRVIKKKAALVEPRGSLCYYRIFS
jgi:hypothetical protein